MTRIISVGKDSLWRKFNSLDLFTKLLIITLILLAIVTPLIVNNYQIFKSRGETEVQRLQAIAQIQDSQAKLRNALIAPTIKPVSSAPSNSAGGFNLIDAIYKLFASIANIFK